MLVYTLKNLGAEMVRGEEQYVMRVIDSPIERDDYFDLKNIIKKVGVTKQFKDVINTFNTPETETPAGFKRGYSIEGNDILRIDLIRDISYDKNGMLRPTSVLFSADSANPYEIAPISNLISNLTCNPGIVYDLFINNPKANVGKLYKTRDEVMMELAKILDPGCDVSVELNNPFEEDFAKILEEAEKFKEIFSKYRIVIKVPHTGPVTSQNVHMLLEGNKHINCRYYDVTTEGALKGHNLALKLREAGYRINFTLMFEPYQSQLALQARPYFINTFVRHRLTQSMLIRGYLEQYDETNDSSHLIMLKEYLIKNDYLAHTDAEMKLNEIMQIGRDLIEYRQIENPQGSDGLDSMRHNMRILKNCNMLDTRLIVCSMEGPYIYPAIDKLLCEPEFIDMNNKVVITAEPNYLARFTSTNQVISYQRRFMNAAKGES